VQLMTMKTAMDFVQLMTMKTAMDLFDEQRWW
jgi:hypothetical protein